MSSGPLCLYFVWLWAYFNLSFVYIPWDYAEFGVVTNSRLIDAPFQVGRLPKRRLRVRIVSDL